MALGSQVFESSGTFNWPSGVTEALVECWGGGGGAGATTGGEGGGGGGAYSRSLVERGAASSATVTVGAGLAAGILGAAGTSSFVQGGATLCSAVGGETAAFRNGGDGGVGASGVGNIVRTDGGDGGNSGGILANGGAGGGSSGSRFISGIAGSPNSGTTGGAGGADVSHAVHAGGNGGDNGMPGESGTGPGAGGGGGGGSGGNGGDGFRGEVRVIWPFFGGTKYSSGCCCDWLPCDSCATPFVNSSKTRSRYPQTAVVEGISFAFSDEATGGETTPNCDQCDFFGNGDIVLRLAESGPNHAVWRFGVIEPLNPYYFGATGTCDTDYDPEVEYDISSFSDPNCICNTTIGDAPFSLRAERISATYDLRWTLETPSGTLDVTSAFEDVDTPCGVRRGAVLPDSVVIPCPEDVRSVGSAIPPDSACIAGCTRAAGDVTISFSDWIETQFAKPLPYV